MANMIPISTVTVGSGGVSSINFTGIPQTYTDLCLKISARSNVTGSSNVSDISVRLNGDSGSNYSYRGVGGTGSTAETFSFSSQSIFTYFAFGGSASATANTFGNSELYIPNYTSTNSKSLSGDVLSENNATLVYMRLMAGLWSNSAPINQITLTVVGGYDFTQYSTATLYGIRKY